MTKYAKFISETQIQFPTAAEFPGVPNFMQHDKKLRDKGYAALEGVPEDRPGFSTVLDRFSFTPKKTTRREKRQVLVPEYEEDPETHERRKIGEHYEMQDQDIEVDISFITVLEHHYEEIPAPEPEPEPDTTERDNAEKAIVGRIAALATKYNALSDLAGLEITIPNLLALAAEKSVTDADLQSVKSDVAILVLDLMAKEGGDWQSCWEGLKSRFVQWMNEINIQA